MNGKHRHNRRGFSVIEIPVAMSILTVGILFLFGAFPSTFDAIGLGRSALSESEIAQWQLERIRNLGFSQTNVSTNGNITVTENSTQNGVTSMTKYIYSITISPYIDSTSCTQVVLSPLSCPSSPSAGTEACANADVCSNVMSAADKKDIKIIVYEKNFLTNLHIATIDSRMAR